MDSAGKNLTLNLDLNLNLNPNVDLNQAPENDLFMCSRDIKAALINKSAIINDNVTVGSS